MHTLSGGLQVLHHAQLVTVSTLRIISTPVPFVPEHDLNDLRI